MLPITLPPNLIPELDALARSLNLPEFDLLLIGDGSGNTAHRTAGWGCLAYDRRKQEVILHAGATTCGTNNFAELMPFVQALWYHDATLQPPHSPSPRVLSRTVIVSDSEVTVRCGTGMYTQKANGALWAAIRWFESQGYAIFWKHVPRNSNFGSSAMDQLAGYVRRLIGTLDVNPKTKLSLSQKESLEGREGVAC